MAKYRVKQGYITQKIGGKTTLFSGEDSVLFTLNETAGYIFNCIKLHWSIEKIVNGLTKEYHVSKETAKKDVVSLLQTLQKKGIIEKAS